jgi:very-short-patch-repair endonuclease
VKEKSNQKPMNEFEDPLAKPRQRIGQIFKYIRALQSRKSPPTLELLKHPWLIHLDSIPHHPSINISIPLQIHKSSSEEQEMFRFEINRPISTPCPEPGTILREWLCSGWEVFGKNPDWIESKNVVNNKGQTLTIHFDEIAARIEAKEQWLTRRIAWEEAETPVQKTLQIFAKFYELRGRLEREAEKYQLWLADGHLSWKSPLGAISHPLLLKKIELLFDPKKPSFSIIETDDPPEINTSLLRFCELDGKHISSLAESLKMTPCHPLGQKETEGFFKQIVHMLWQDGEFSEVKPSKEPGEKPIIWRNPVLYLGTRTQGFDAAMVRIENFLEETSEIPEALLRLVGHETKIPQGGSSFSPHGTGCEAESGHLSLPADVLLTSPANDEQIRVIRKLKEAGSVIVQGPPGTGKTHTIANLIGHLLAEGQTVLVTSHTSKALRVLRDKVHPALRALCVSVLETDEESRRELEESVAGIVGYLSRTDRQKIHGEISILERRREELMKEHDRLCRELLAAKRSEYEELLIGGRGTPPSTAARFLAEYPIHGWIPGPIREGVAIPLSHEEILDLYATNTEISPEMDRILSQPLPEPNMIPSESDFFSLVDELKNIENTGDKRDLIHNVLPKNIDDLSSLLAEAKSLLTEFHSEETWYLEALIAGHEGESSAEPWHCLSKILRSSRDKIRQHHELLVNYEPNAIGPVDRVKSVTAAQEITAHLNAGGKLGMLSLLFKSEWKTLISSHRVNGQDPKVAVHFQAIAALHEVDTIRDELKRRWIRQMEPLNALPIADLGGRPEENVHPFSDKIDRALVWSKEKWSPFLDKISKSGLNWKMIRQKSEDSTLGKPAFIRIRAILEAAAITLDAEIRHLRKVEIQSNLDELRNLLLQFSGNSETSHPVFQLRTAVETCDYILYQRARRKLIDIVTLEMRLRRRADLLVRLESSAAGWAFAIRARQAPHDQGIPPGADIDAAWSFRQWETQLSSRHKVLLDDLQRKHSASREDIYRESALLVEKLAWKAQLERTALKQSQALNGWLDIQKKMGKGHTKRMARLQKEARELLAQCKDAVPVWIMPTSRVYESFDPGKAQFDVIVIDEASQCDVTNLALLSMARRVVVVGDHEQVSPYAVGQEIETMQALIDEMLEGVPNAIIYDPKTSIYQLARQSFGETIRLVEHFRCVPDIIAFSNALSYSGEIKPLREASDAKVAPALISHRVKGSVYDAKINIREIEEITALVLATNEHPAYRGMSFGVISMVGGGGQAMRIEESLRRHLSSEHYAERRLLCGSPSEFQGDERNIIFISMVYAPNDDSGPLHMLSNDEARKVFNVAASRAQDQLWVIHSLNADTDLKEGDLRKRLIRYAESPESSREQLSKVETRAESEFEKLVARSLTAEGFRIQLQWEVGAYRIDMVVFDKSGNRVALECDGDRWHPPEKHSEDLSRQFVLERLGWRFVRIRGSEFFYDQKATMDRVIARLRELGIEADLTDTVKRSDKADLPDLKREVITAAESWLQKIRIRNDLDQEPLNQPKAPRERKLREAKS